MVFPVRPALWPSCRPFRCGVFTFFRPGQMALRLEPDLSWAQKCLEAAAAPNGARAPRCLQSSNMGWLVVEHQFFIFPEILGISWNFESSRKIDEL